MTSFEYTCKTCITSVHAASSSSALLSGECTSGKKVNHGPLFKAWLFPATQTRQAEWLAGLAVFFADKKRPLSDSQMMPCINRLLLEWEQRQHTVKQDLQHSLRVALMVVALAIQKLLQAVRLQWYWSSSSSRPTDIQ